MDPTGHLDLSLGSGGHPQYRAARLAPVLMNPLASETVSQVQHHLTGRWNLEDYLGHDAYIVHGNGLQV